MLTDHRCTKYTDCSSLWFLPEGYIQVSSLSERVCDPSDKMHAEHGILPDQGRDLAEQRGSTRTLRSGGQFVLQPIGSKVECKVLDYTECIIYLFERPQNICDNRFNKGISIVENERQQPIVMTMVPRYNSSSRA